MRAAKDDHVEVRGLGVQLVEVAARHQRGHLAVEPALLDELHAEAPDLDVIVLGCTHYPLLRPLLARITGERWGHPVTLVDSATTMAEETATLLTARGLTAIGGEGSLRCAVTDDARFDEIGARFLGRSLGELERVDL